MIEYRIGDVFERMAEIPDGSIDLIVTSPPFLALRSYLPADHPDKAKEIGSEATPAAFIDTLLALSAEWGRVLAPHGSLCVELGDTYSGGEASSGPRTNNLYNTGASPTAATC
jgi:DNA modification methylase